MMKSIAQLGFAIGLLILFVLCLMPGGDMPDIDGYDKVFHCLAYVMLAACGRLAFPSRRGLIGLFVGLAGLGAAIELAQMLVPNRDAEILDEVADIVGILIGLGIGEVLRRPIYRLASGLAAR